MISLLLNPLWNDLPAAFYKSRVGFSEIIIFRQVRLFASSALLIRTEARGRWK